jgi:hypothetical protein
MDIFKIKELSKCCDDFPYFCENYVKVNHPTRGLIPLKLYNFQENLVEIYNKEQFVILTKFRNGGFTTVSAIWGLWQCLFQSDKNVMIGCCTNRNAEEIYKNIINPVINALPEWMCSSIGKNNLHHIEFKENNSNLLFHNMEPAKGRMIDCLIIDEAAFHKNMEEKWKAIYPCLDKCFILSTVTGMNNWFAKTYHAARAGENKFKVFYVDHMEHPDHTDNWCKEMRESIETGWNQEILQKFWSRKPLQ